MTNKFQQVNETKAQTQKWQIMKRHLVTHFEILTFFPRHAVAGKYKFALEQVTKRICRGLLRVKGSRKEDLCQGLASNENNIKQRMGDDYLRKDTLTDSTLRTM